MPPADDLRDIKTSITRAEPTGEDAVREWKVKVFRWQGRTAAICLLARAVLLYQYAECLIRAQDANFIPKLHLDNLVASTFFFMELSFTLYRLYPQHLQSIQFASKARLRPRLWISGSRVPTVDILVFYCGEELSVLLDTARAACSIDYPRDRFRVVVLDDSSTVSNEIEALQAQFSNLFYSARTNKRAGWHKAGNINHGLDYVASLSGGKSEFVAGLDVDMIPQKDWLRRSMPHLVQDAKMGLVSPRQRFYNVPDRDPLGQLRQFDQLQHVRNLRKDFGDTGLGAGTGWLARRSAVDSIGGFAADGISEDFLTCIDLMEAGWTVALLDENLQWGLVPDSFNGHIKQYQRWMTAMLSFYRAIFGPKSKRKQLAFRILGEFSTFFYMVAMVLCYFGLPLLVISGRPMVRYADRDQFKLLLRCSLIDFMAQSIHGFLESYVADFTIYSWHDPSHLWHSAFFIMPFLRHYRPNLASAIYGTFTTLHPATSAMNQSTEDKYRSPSKRLQVMLRECHVLPHLFVLGSCTAGLVALLAGSRNPLQLTGNRKDVFERIITRVGWPPALFLWTAVFRNALIPFSYALLVPPRREREEYLSRDKKSRVAYPTDQAKEYKHRQVWEWHLCLIGVYFCGVTIGSWWL